MLLPDCTKLNGEQVTYEEEGNPTVISASSAADKKLEAVYSKWTTSLIIIIIQNKWYDINNALFLQFRLIIVLS